MVPFCQRRSLCLINRSCERKPQTESKQGSDDLKGMKTHDEGECLMDDTVSKRYLLESSLRDLFCKDLKLVKRAVFGEA